jgi:hypothetical protein
MFWKNILLIPIVLVTLAFSRNKENQVKVDFSGYDRDLTSINWNGVAVDFSTVNKAAFDAGYIEIQDLVVISELSSSSQIKITATHAGWSTLPTGYSGNKTATSGDVQIFVDNLASLSAYSGSDFSSTYTAITDSGNNIIESSGSVSGATGDINARILLDWADDTKGSYNLSLQFTVTNY